MITGKKKRRHRKLKRTVKKEGWSREAKIAIALLILELLKTILDLLKDR